MRTFALTTAVLLASSCLAHAQQQAGAAATQIISPAQINRSATALLKLTWKQRREQFRRVTAGTHPGHSEAPHPQSAELILALLEAERRFMRLDDGTEPDEEYGDYVAGLVAEAGALKNPAAINALIDPILLDWGYNYRSLGEIGGPVVDRAIAEFHRSTNILHRGMLLMTLTVVMEETSSLPEEKRERIKALAMAFSVSSDLGLRLVAIKCLAAFHDSDVTARLTDLKDHSPVEPVRIAAGFALRGIAFPGQSR
jgi:hypothetical protein